MSDNRFLEKQYLGLNKMSISRRMSLALFCFFAYYLKENNDKSGELFFFLGVVIIIISILLVFVLHFETRVQNQSVILDGLWTSRKVKIDLNSIKSIRRIKYSKYIINRAVYNLHLKGKIRFYTRGDDAIELVDRDGLIYLIGSQKAEELERIIKKQKEQ